MEKTHNPHKKPHYVVSACCKGKIATIPACMGDPIMRICMTCTNECDEELRPMYEEVSKGTFRLINYKD